MKKTLLIFALLVSISSTICSQTQVKADSLEVTPSELADMIIKEALKLQGTPYRYGATGPRAYDCSAFTRHIYSKFGYSLPRTSTSQANHGREVTGSFSNLQKGDLLIFGSRRSKRNIGHVGIFIELDENGKDFTFIHAATSGGVKVSHLSETYYKERLLGVRRIIPDFINISEDNNVNLLKMENTVVEMKDTLSLGTGDSRLILLSSGNWLFVDNEGNVSSPAGNSFTSLFGGDSRLILTSDGRWEKMDVSTVLVPKIAESTQPVSQSSGSSSSGSSGAVYYTIKSGDTLSGIAAKYHTSVSALCRLNGIKSTSILHIGKKIRVK